MSRSLASRITRSALALTIGAAAVLSAMPTLAETPAAQPSAADSTSPDTTPRPAVRGIYVSANTAGSQTGLGRILNLLDRTELNAVVVDVKNDSGDVTFATDDPAVTETGATSRYITDIGTFLETLRLHRVYRIARIVTFKDLPAVAAHPEWAVADVDGGVWKDRNGMTWLNPYNEDAWAYVVAVARAAAKVGFDEIQFDYVRFPTDGDTSRIVYPGKDGRSQARVIADFLAYARRQLKQDGVPVSADVFGLVTSFTDDMGIGQHLEDVAASVDYVSPMLYPSHYTRGNLGIDNPNASPYQTVFRSLRDATRRIGAAGLTGQVTMRPWLQDFSMGYDYGPEEVAAQIQATRDAGYSQFLLWNAANVYTQSALATSWPAADDPFRMWSGEVGPAVTVMLNHQRLTSFDAGTGPFLARSTGRTLVPLRAVAEAIGATVAWDNDTLTASLAYNGHQVQLPLNSRSATADGQLTRLEQTAVIWHDRTVVPLRFLTESLGATVTWDGSTHTVDIVLPN